MVRMKRSRWVVRAALFVSGLVFGLSLSGRSTPERTPSIKTLLENGKVLVSEVAYEKEASRPTHVRQNDQETRTRKAGDVIWHSRGETAPNLTNTGEIAYRTIVVNLK